MKSITRFAKRALSLVLCLTVVMTTVLFFDIGIIKSEAAVSTVPAITNSAAQADVLFYVPEAIYLRPVSYSWGAASKSKFHFFVENDVVDGSGNLMTQPSVKSSITTGNGMLYFKYANATNVAVEIRYLKTDMSGSYNDGGALSLLNQKGDPAGAKGIYWEINREMESPTLAATDTGCILEWRLKYHDTTDNLDKIVVAYSYVYKPYVVAITTGIEVVELFHDDQWNEHISWITGIHEVVSEATAGQRYARYGASGYTGAKGFMPFLTSGNLDGINGSGATGSILTTKNGAADNAPSGAKQLNAYFASTDDKYNYFFNDQNDGRISSYNGTEYDTNGQPADNWHVDSAAADKELVLESNGYYDPSKNEHASTSSSSALNKAVHVFSEHSRDPGGTDDACVWKSYRNNSVGGIYIDTSRYKDLSQVPNLGIGLTKTNSKDTNEDGSWYVGDCTGLSLPSDTADGNDYYGANQDGKWTGSFDTIWDNKNYAIAGAGNKSSTVSQGAWCETKYAGTWARTLLGGNNATQMYRVRMVTYTHKNSGDAVIASTVMQMQAKQYDKSSLRTAVNNAIKVFARLGVSDINSSNANEFVSHYFDNTGAYKTFVDAYKAAYKALIALDKDPGNVSTLATNLTNAINAINTDTASRKTSVANQYHIGVLKNSDGETYRIVELPGDTHDDTEYKFGNKVEFTAETFENCKFLGAIKLVADIGSNGATSLVNDSYNLLELPEFVSDGHWDDHDAIQDSGTKVTSFPHVESTNPRPSTEFATVDESGSKITYPYMAEHNVTYCYFYEVITSEVRFGNEFDFDATRWHKPANANQRVDFVNNTVTLESLSGSVYTDTGIIANQPNYMNLMPGRTYRFSLKYENLSDEPAPIHALGYTWARTTDTAYEVQGWAKVEKQLVVPAKGEGYIHGTITVPSVAADGHDSPYATVRVGIADYNGVSATGKKVMFSDICIRDISTYYTKEENGKTVFGTNTIYLAGDSSQDFTKIPLDTTGTPGTTITVNYADGSAPKIARSGYQFAGWSEDRLETGNGGTPVTTTTLPAYGSKILYPVWRVNVIYDTDGGQYRKSDDPLDRNNYIAEGRWNLDPCTDVAVSNRIKYTRGSELEGWNSTDLDLSYVPFKQGYNFDGWEVSAEEGKGSIDLKIKGKVFWPGEYVPAEANVEFKARWTEATEIDTSAQTIPVTHNGKEDNPATQATVYPGQIVFYCFTPTERDMYVSAYTFNNGEADTEINWLKNNGDLSENDNAIEHADVAALQGKVFEYFGLTKAEIGFDETKDSLLTAQLEQGDKTYLGVTLHHCHISSKDELHFQMKEHKVIYELNANAGTFDDNTNKKFVEGYGGVDTELQTNVDLFGYTLAGWKTAESEAFQKEYYISTGKCVVPGADNTTWLSGYTESFEKPVKLEPIWVYEKFTLVFDGNKKANESTIPENLPADQELTYNTSSNLPEKNPPTRDGYTFKGWALDPEPLEGEILYTSELPVEEVNTLYATMKTSGSQYARLYARWSPNIIIVRFKNDVNTAETHTQKFFFDQKQKLDEVKFTAEPFTVNFYDVNPENGVESFYKSGTADRAIEGWISESNVIDPATGNPYYYEYGDTIRNPNGVFGYSDQEEGAMETILFTDWSRTKASIETPLLVHDNSKYVLAGWATEEDKNSVVVLAGDRFEATYEGQNLYAVWYSKDKADQLEDDIVKYQIPYQIVSGIIIKDADLTVEESYEEIPAGTVPEYDTKYYQSLIDSYIAAQNLFEQAKQNGTSKDKVDANNALLAAIRELEAVPTPEKSQVNKEYLSKFKIQYADSVPESERTVADGVYSLADFNLNHYTEDLLGATKTTFESADNYEIASEQSKINKIVVTLARAYASKEDVKTSTPVYKVYDTVASLKGSGISYSDDVEAMSYVYTGKGNYTYYCYTNSMTPTLYLVVDENVDVDGRACFPTTAEPYGDRVGTGGANPTKPDISPMTDTKALNKYKPYLQSGIGTTPVLSVDADGNKEQGTSEYYGRKSLITLTPDFTGVPQSSVSATVEYTFTAYDDAYTGAENKDVNYADAASLMSKEAKGQLADIPQGEKATNQSDGKVVTPENTITIKIDYHVSDANGGKLGVKADQTEDDKWLTQYHLYRSSGGASNWDLPMPDDTVYKVNDPTFGPTGYGSFTYTFVVGEENDFENSVLTSADVEEVKQIIKKNYNAIKSDTFIGRQKDKNAGLGYLAWKNTTWSFNYYPKSNAYTYVHLIDRWGNVVDEVIQVPNIDGTATTLTTLDAGDVNVVEAGGSGIDTMSLSAPSIEFITDENSTFDGTTYTTTGNTVKVYTGEANKKYSLVANDVAANKTTANVTTDAEGYLTLTVEDLDFDTQSGDMYTFTLNDTTINLYAESDHIILSAEDVVGEGETATVSITTTDEATMVQLVSASGTTATATEYTEDENGNRVWQINVKKNPGSYEYEVRAKVDGKWISEGKTVTVTIKEPTIFVGAVTAVEYTPSTDTRNEFMFTVTGRADKVQVIEPDGGTRTYDRYHAKVVIVSYDEEGNVIGSMSRELCYEVWTIEMNVPADIELTAIARYGRQWSTNAPYVYMVTLLEKELDDEVYSMELASTEGKQGKVQATVITGLDVSGVRFVMDNDTTTTYYNPTEADGRLTYIGNAWMNHSGENIIIVKIRVKNAWLNAGELTYQAI